MAPPCIVWFIMALLPCISFRCSFITFWRSSGVVALIMRLRSAGTGLMCSSIRPIGLLMFVDEPG